MKKLLSVITMVAVLLTGICLIASANDSVELRGASFFAGGKPIFVIEEGVIYAKISVENKTQAAIDANLYIASYNADKLEAFASKSISIAPGIASYITPMLNTTDQTSHVKVFVWDNDIRPIGSEDYLLNDVSCDTSLASCVLTVNGTEYIADVNKNKNTASFTLNCTVSGTENTYNGEEVAVTSVEGAKIELTDDSELTSGKVYKVTAANGNTAIYDVKAFNAQLGWDEKFTGSVISDKTTTGINGVDYPDFAPTYGTWNNGEYRSDGWGTWRNRSSNDAIVLSVNKEKDEKNAENTYMSMNLGNSTNDQVYYTVKNPLPTAGVPNCKRFALSFDFRGRELVSGGTYGWFGNFVSGFVISGSNDSIYLLQRLNGADSSPITIATTSMNEWHNLKIVAEKTSDGFEVEYYLDGDFCYGHTNARKYTYQGYTNTDMTLKLDSAVRFFLLGGTSGTLDFDNFNVLFNRV